MFIGIALGGCKAAGKDLILDHLAKTRSGVELVRCKTPIVQAYEKIVGHPYDKARDDAELIHISATQIRGGQNGNDNIVPEYLRTAIPDLVWNTDPSRVIVVVPDMRRKPENDVLFDELNMLCVKVEASEDIRVGRLLARDKHLGNYKPDDDTEREVDSLRYHYVIDNNRNDGGEFAIRQLEEILYRVSDRFRRVGSPDTLEGSHVRVIDPTSGWFWSTGDVVGERIEGTRTAKMIVQMIDDHDEPCERIFLPSDLLVI